MRIIDRPCTLLVLAAIALYLGGCDSANQKKGAGAKAPPAEPKKVERPKVEVGKEISTASGLKYTDLKEGTGKEAEQGDWVTVNYKGWIKDPKEPFDSTEGKRPFTAQLVPGGLIQGWIEGVPGMKEGGKRKLIIPYQLAYGERGMPPGIPPKSDLTFEIELVKVTR
jgi:FKBP-type peptidyl-prolyl cis-trans isomerase